MMAIYRNILKGVTQQALNANCHC